MTDERIEDISSLDYLKKYACQQFKYKREWYLNCVDCKELKKCKAGQQAMVIMDNETRAAEKHPETPQETVESRKRQTVVDIFESPDPVRKLLESFPTIKPQSVYAKVNIWRKNYPDLEKKYHMMDKVRFLWTKPYDAMKVPDILKMMYPDVKSAPAPIPKPAHRNEPPKKEEDDQMDISDFLKEAADNFIVAQVSKPEVKTLEKKAGESNLDGLIAKLEHEKEELRRRIQEIDQQIEAVRTTMKLMSSL